MVSQNVTEIIKNHVVLEVEGIDRMYLNAYVPGLQRDNVLYHIGCCRQAHRSRPLRLDFGSAQPIQGAHLIVGYQERLEALLVTYNLANQVLVVSAMLFNQNAFKGQAFNDGVITQRNTFQKYFTQNELKEFLTDALEI
jgi:hypothetical protein